MWGSSVSVSWPVPNLNSVSRFEFRHASARNMQARNGTLLEKTCGLGVHELGIGDDGGRNRSVSRHSNAWRMPESRLSSSGSSAVLCTWGIARATLVGDLDMSRHRVHVTVLQSGASGGKSHMCRSMNQREGGRVVVARGNESGNPSFRPTRSGELWMGGFSSIGRREVTLAPSWHSAQRYVVCEI